MLASLVIVNNPNLCAIDTEKSINNSIAMSNDYKYACSLKEVKPGTTKKICFPGQAPILIANVDGTIYAVDDTCTHEDSSLSLGCLRGDKVKCTLHGSWFSVVTGEPSEEPADEPLNRYSIYLRHDEIWVSTSPIE